VTPPRACILIMIMIVMVMVVIVMVMIVMVMRSCQWLDGSVVSH
jgi:hypothetical protein